MVALKCKCIICLVSLTVVPTNDSQEETQIDSKQNRKLAGKINT